MNKPAPTYTHLNYVYNARDTPRSLTFTLSRQWATSPDPPAISPWRNMNDILWRSHPCARTHSRLNYNTRNQNVPLLFLRYLILVPLLYGCLSIDSGQLDLSSGSTVHPCRSRRQDSCLLRRPCHAPSAGRRDLRGRYIGICAESRGP